MFEGRGLFLFSIFFFLFFMGAGCAQGTPRFSEPYEAEAPVEELSYAELEELEALLNQQQTTTMNQDVPETPSEEALSNATATIQTEKGDIVIELFGDTAPKATSNFIKLSNDGYYDGLTFHRREEGFVIQGGDPAGNGTGGPGYTFEDELEDDYSYDRGIVAMANRGPNTNGSQFFIMLADVPLPKAYTIFGRVTSGMEVVDAIAIGDKMTTVEVK